MKLSGSSARMYLFLSECNTRKIFVRTIGPLQRPGCRMASKYSSSHCMSKSKKDRSVAHFGYSRFIRRNMKDCMIVLLYLRLAIRKLCQYIIQKQRFVIPAHFA